MTSNTSNTVTEVDFDYFLTFPLDLDQPWLDQYGSTMNVVFKYEYWGDKD